MKTPEPDSSFSGSIPSLYEAHLVPMVFAPYAADLAQRLRGTSSGQLLELAAGTGVVTRAIAVALPEMVSIVATDLNPGMLHEAERIGTSRPVSWSQADALQLPFDNASFDVVVCQFGVMFFPDKARAFAEVRRVLRPGGKFIFSVWDSVETNEFADVLHQTLHAMFPDSAPFFIARTPHGYHDRATIERDLRDGGLSAPPLFDTVARRSHAPSARIAAIAYCYGTPMRNEFESHGARSVDQLSDRYANALAERFGPGVIDGAIQAIVVTVVRDDSA